VIVITDTSVVLNLCALRQERLLAEIFGHILAPPSVVQEFQRLVSVDPRFADLTFPLFVEVSSASQIAPELLLNERLHQGEREALSLAAELGADAVLMDERAGRAVASSLGIPSIGVLGILVQAKTLGLLPVIKPLLDQLHHQARFWIAPALMQQVLNSVGE
jgi:predicted nucleic acid-binding protein